MTGAALQPAVYVHVPFCATRCAYCDFYSTTDEGLVDAWAEAVVREAESACAQGVRDVPTVYLGGGTPSRLDAARVAALLGRLRGALRPAPGVEVTIEANPDDVEPDLVAAWRDAGVTRVSLGVQSFDGGELALLERRHDAARARRAVDVVRGAGGLDLALDLIFAIPGSPPSAWRRTLIEALAIGPEHVSCYQLTLEPGARLAARLAATGASLPGEEAQRAAFLEAHERLGAAGFDHYEISNWARPGKRSRHNQTYWRHEPYRGLGPAAHSYDGARTRWWNSASVREYVEAIACPAGAAAAGREILTDDQLLLEQVMLGLRTADGVVAEVLGRTPGGVGAAEALVARGLLVRRGDRYVPTVRGMLVADGLPGRFW
jgi:oxygen-independent coproporphyrinogen-3 oxidase